MSVELVKRLEHRLALQPTGQLKDCCAGTILKQYPRTLGDRLQCTFCGEFLKTIEAADFEGAGFVGALNETKRMRGAIGAELSRLWFDKRRFTTPDAVLSWCGQRGIKPTQVAEKDMVFEAEISKVQLGTERALLADRGVLAEVGIPFEKTVATGALVSGGQLNPTQGGPSGGWSTHVKAYTDTQDGHVHEVNLPLEVNRTGGQILNGLTSVTEEHAHLVRCSVAPDGTIDAYTEPSAPKVSGHSHKHRLVYRHLSAEKEAGPAQKVQVTPRQLASLRRAATMLETHLVTPVSKTSGVPEGGPVSALLSDAEAVMLSQFLQWLDDLLNRFEEEATTTGAVEVGDDETSEATTVEAEVQEAIIRLRRASAES